MIERYIKQNHSIYLQPYGKYCEDNVYKDIETNYLAIFKNNSLLILGKLYNNDEIKQLDEDECEHAHILGFSSLEKEHNISYVNIIKCDLEFTSVKEEAKYIVETEKYPYINACDFYAF